MKILVTSLPDLKRIHPQRPHHLLKYLSKKHEITVLSVNAWWLEDNSNGFFQKYLADINFYYMSKNGINPILQEINLKKNLKKLDLDLGSFDVHINFNSLIGGYILTKKTELATVFDVCDDLVEWVSISPNVPKLLKSIGKFLANLMLKKNISSSRMVTFSIDSLRELFDAPIEKSKIIPNGVDADLFCKETFNKVSFNNTKEFTIGFVGFLGDWVDFYPIFEVLEELKDIFKIRMIIVGDGDSCTKFQNMAKEMGIYDQIEFKGDVEYFRVPEFISLMDVCILPFDMSKISQGALPLKLFEYMACEKPVISTPLKTVEKSVGNLVLYAKSSEELKKHIVELYSNNEKRLELGSEGRQFVKENYSWEKISIQFEELIYQVNRI